MKARYRRGELCNDRGEGGGGERETEGNVDKDRANNGVA